MKTEQFNDVVSRWAPPPAPVVVSDAVDSASTGDSREDILGCFNVRRPSSGYIVSEKTSMAVATVYRCVSIIGGSIAQLPIHHYKRKPDGTRERVAGSSLWWLLNESPIDAWTSAAWKEYIVYSVLLRGDSFAELVRKAGGTGVARIKPHAVGNVEVLQRTDGTLLYSVTDDDGSRRTVLAEDMLHFTGVGFDGLRSLSIMQYAAQQAIGNSLAAGDYSGRAFSSGTVPKLSITFEKKITRDQAEELRTSWASTYNGPAGGNVPLVLHNGAKVDKLSISPHDAQLIESRKYEKEDICTAFGVPPIMVGSNEKASSWGTGIEQVMIGFVNFTLKPHLIRFEEELNRKLFARAGQFVEFELGGLLRGDSKAQSDYYKAALGGPGSGPGWMSVNEVRALQNLPPVDGGDQPFYPETGKANEEQTTQPPAKQRPGPPEPPSRE